MKTNTVLLGISALLCMLLGACLALFFRSSGCESDSGFTTGERTMLSDGIERVYYVRLPENYNSSDTSYPLIFAFHGLTGDYTNWTEGYYDLQDVVGDEAILVYPNALVTNDKTQWHYQRDVLFFDDLHTELEENLCFDKRKVFAVGHSNGAGMTHALGCQRGSILRAIAPVAGSLLDYESCGGQVSVIMTHGSNDTIMPVGQTASSREYWIAINSCNKGEPEEGMDPMCDAYSGCDFHFPVQYCEHSEGHDWPVFASEAIWNFFTHLPPAVPSDKPSDVDIENLGKGTISFKVLYPADFVGTPDLVALALYPYDSTQPFGGSPLSILDLEIPPGEYTFGEVTEYEDVEIDLLGVEYGDYALTVIVFVEGSSHPMPGDGIDYMGVQNFTLDSDTLEVITPFELELVKW